MSHPSSPSGGPPKFDALAPGGDGGEPSASEDHGASTGRPSARQRRAEADALLRLAKTLVELRPAQLADVPLPTEVRAEVEICRPLRKGARVRQLRRVSQLLRRLELAPIVAAAEDDRHRQRPRAQRERRVEHWGRRLCEQGDPALAELLAEHPRADRQRLRQLMRQVRKAPEGPAAATARRGLLRALRSLLAGDGDARSE